MKEDISHNKVTHISVVDKSPFIEEFVVNDFDERAGLHLSWRPF